ncbi:MAG: bifunctional diguanylate cyclase/phosphodiesterase [Clostridia bacterium]
MTWNIVPEWIAGILLIIIMVYSRKALFVHTVRDRMFRNACYSVLFSIFFNLLSTYMIYSYQSLPHMLVMGVTTIYYIITPLMPLIYFYYAICILYYDYSFERMHPLWRLWAIPYLLYFIVILLNPFVHNIFCVLPDRGYVQQAWVSLPYVIFYFYSAATVLFAFINRKRVEKRIIYVILLFPFLALGLVVTQNFMPDVILTGTAGFTTIFVLYLYLQNQRMVADELTGLLNRRTFLKSLELAAKIEKPFTVILLGIRNFKHINSRFGAQAGDALLCSIGQYLSTLAASSFLYRLDGDQFALILHDTQSSQVQSTIESIQKRFEQSWTLKGIECVLGIRIATLTYPEAGKTARELQSVLAYLVSTAKKSQSNVVLHYDATIYQDILRRQSIQDALETALQNHGFEVFYQPIWEASSGTFTQAEALLRMKPLDIGSVYPDEFIPIAEESGFIVDITYWVLDQACKTLKKLDSLNLPQAQLSCISVNFSFLQFLQPDITERVLEIIHQNGISPNRIKIEITERLLIDDGETVSQLMEKMHTLGMRFALDDFGVGFSNVAGMLNLPFDDIKIDKSIVWSTLESQVDSHFLRHLVHAFSALERTIIAEGIETQAQLDYVLACGCQEIQGYFFAKPMSEALLIPFLSKS